MEDLLKYALENTEIEELIRRCFGRRKNKEFVKRVAKSIVESVVVEELSKAKNKDLKKIYGKTGALKKKVKEKKKKIDDINEDSKIEYNECLYEYEMQQKKQNKVEHTFAQGIKKFLSIFRDAFENEAILHKELNKVFKNYKFKDKNIVNNYTVFYFTFKLFESFCYAVEDMTERKQVAIELAEKAHEELKAIGNKGNVKVSQKSIVKYLSKFPLEDPCYAYTSILIDFVKDSYFSSELDDIVRYDIYSAFGAQIIRINTMLETMLNEIDNEEDAYEEEYDIDKIYKSVYNKMQYMKKKLEPEIIEKFKLLNHSMRKIPKSIAEYNEISVKTYSKYGYAVFENIIDILDSENDEAKKLLNKVLKEYSKIRFEDNADLNVLTVAFMGCSAQIYEKVKKMSGTSFETMQKGENVYVSLMLSSRKRSSTERELEIDEILESVVKLLRTYINNNIEISEIAIKKYEEIVTRVELNFLNLQILLMSDEVPLYPRNIHSIAFNLFVLMK